MAHNTDCYSPQSGLSILRVRYSRRTHRTVRASRAGRHPRARRPPQTSSRAEQGEGGSPPYVFGFLRWWRGLSSGDIRIQTKGVSKKCHPSPDQCGSGNWPLSRKPKGPRLSAQSGNRTHLKRPAGDPFSHGHTCVTTCPVGASLAPQQVP